MQELKEAFQIFTKLLKFYGLSKIDSQSHWKKALFKVLQVSFVIYYIFNQYNESFRFAKNSESEFNLRKHHIVIIVIFYLKSYIHNLTHFIIYLKCLWRSNSLTSLFKVFQETDELLLSSFGIKFNYRKSCCRNTIILIILCLFKVMTTASGILASLRDIINLNSIFTNFLSIVFHLHLSFIILICWEIKVRIRALNQLVIRLNMTAFKTNKRSMKRYDNLHILHNQFNITIKLFNQIFGFDLMILTGNIEHNSNHLMCILFFRQIVC